MRKITIHKVDDLDKATQPICGKFISSFDAWREQFISIHEASVTCSACLKKIEELKHIKDGRLVF